MAYLPGVEVNHDHEGGSSRMRLSHCTSGQLTPTMVSNVDHLNAQFLLVGSSVRADPDKTVNIILILALSSLLSCPDMTGKVSPAP